MAHSDGQDWEDVLRAAARQLAEPRPYDLDDVDLKHYRRLELRWRDWTTVADACRALSVAMLDELADDLPPDGAS